MTDQELRDLVAATTQNIERMSREAEVRRKELDELFAETDRRFEERSAETDRRFEERSAETDRRFEERSAETDRRFAETDRRFAETDRRMEEADRRGRERDEQLHQELREYQQETARQFRELGKQIGGLGNKFGSFTESLALPSAERLLRERFGIEAFTTYLRRRVNGEHIEIDGFGFNNGEQNIGYVVEVKSRLDTRAVEQTLEILGRFRSFFPEFANKTLYGLVAAADATQESIELALQQGLYVIRFHDELMEFIEGKNFTARTF